MAADAAQGLPRREATVCGPGLGGHLRNGPQHVAAQCVGEDVPADALVLARCDEFCDQLGSRWMREGPTHGAGLRKNGPESPTKVGTRQVVRDAACAVAEPGAGSQYEPQPRWACSAAVLQTTCQAGSSSVERAASKAMMDMMETSRKEPGFPRLGKKPRRVDEISTADAAPVITQVAVPPRGSTPAS